MNDSFPIGRLFGIQLRVHVLFVYLSLGLIALGASNGHGLTTAAFLGMLAVLVLLHEFGHALVAQRFGVTVVDIVLWPLGGMARMTELPEDPKVEGWVAIAGPLVNLTLAAVGTLALAVPYGGFGWFHPLQGELTGTESVLRLFVVANLMLGVFNLVPAFPMDGGRLLRAALGVRRDWLSATEVAVRVSRYVALLMIVGAFLVKPFNCMLPFIGVYVLWEGTRELWMTRLRHARAAGGGPFGFGGGPFGFGGPGGGPGPSGPGSGPGGGPSGAAGIDLTELFRRAREAGPQPPPDAGQGQGPGPAPEEDAGPTVEQPPSSGGGFSEEEVRRLEQFRGRLRRPDGDEG